MSRGTTTKAVYKRKHLIGGLLIVLEVYSMAIMARDMVAGRHPLAGTVAESLHPNPKQQVEEPTGNGAGF